MGQIQQAKIILEFSHWNWNQGPHRGWFGYSKPRWDNAGDQKEGAKGSVREAVEETVEKPMEGPLLSLSIHTRPNLLDPPEARRGATPWNHQ